MVIFHTDHWGALAHYIVLALQRHKDEERILIFTEPDSAKTDILKKLQTAGIFNKVIMTRELLQPGAELTNEKEIEERILSQYDKVFLKNGINIQKIKDIYTVTDIHGIFRFYLIKKKKDFIHVALGNHSELYADYRVQEAYKIGAISKEYMNLLKSNNVFYANSPFCVKLIIPLDTILKDNFHLPKLIVERFDLADALTKIDMHMAEEILKCFGCRLDELKHIKKLLLSNSDGYVAPKIEKLGYEKYDRGQHALLYQLLIDFYMKGNVTDLCIKAHPYNYTDWNRYFKGILIMNNSMPIEFINFSPKTIISEALGLQTTAIGKINGKVQKVILATENYAEYYPVLGRFYMACRLFLECFGKENFQQCGIARDFFDSFLKNVMQADRVSCEAAEVWNVTGVFFRIYYKPKLLELWNVSSVIRDMDEKSVLAIIVPPEHIPLNRGDEKMLQNLLVACIDKESTRNEVLLPMEREYIYFFTKSETAKEKILNFRAEKELKITGVHLSVKILQESEKCLLLENYSLRNELAAVRKAKESILDYYHGNPLFLPYFLEKSAIFEEYINLLSVSKNAVVFFAVKDNAGKAYTYQALKYIEQLGLKTAWNNLGWNSYLAIFDGEKVLLEKRGTAGKPSEYFGRIEDIQVEMHSKTYEQGNAAQIILNGIDYALNRRGINIVVYDRSLKRVVDSVCFDTFKETCDCSRK